MRRAVNFSVGQNLCGVFDNRFLYTFRNLFQTRLVAAKGRRVASFLPASFLYWDNLTIKTRWEIPWLTFWTIWPSPADCAHTVVTSTKVVTCSTILTCYNKVTLVNICGSRYRLLYRIHRLFEFHRKWPIFQCLRQNHGMFINCSGWYEKISSSN